jgi:hypothetical protein
MEEAIDVNTWTIKEGLIAIHQLPLVTGLLVCALFTGEGTVAITRMRMEIMIAKSLLVRLEMGHLECALPTAEVIGVTTKTIMVN